MERKAKEFIFQKREEPVGAVTHPLDIGFLSMRTDNRDFHEVRGFSFFDDFKTRFTQRLAIAPVRGVKCLRAVVEHVNVMRKPRCLQLVVEREAPCNVSFARLYP